MFRSESPRELFDLTDPVLYLLSTLGEGILVSYLLSTLGEGILVPCLLSTLGEGILVHYLLSTLSEGIPPHREGKRRFPRAGRTERVLCSQTSVPSIWGPFLPVKGPCVSRTRYHLRRTGGRRPRTDLKRPYLLRTG